MISRVLCQASDTGGAAAVTFAHYALHSYMPEKRRALGTWEDLLLEIAGEKVRPKNVEPLPPRADAIDYAPAALLR